MKKFLSDPLRVIFVLGLTLFLVLLTGQVFADVTGEADEETLPSGQHRFWEFVYIEQGKGMGGAMFGTEAACKERHTEASEDPSIVMISECRSIILAPPKREN